MELVLETNPCLTTLEFAEEKEKTGEMGHMPCRGDETCQRSVAGDVQNAEIPTPTREMGGTVFEPRLR